MSSQEAFHRGKLHPHERRSLHDFNPSFHAILIHRRGINSASEIYSILVPWRPRVINTSLQRPQTALLDASRDRPRASAPHRAGWYAASVLLTEPLLGEHALGPQCTIRCQSDTDSAYSGAITAKSSEVQHGSRRGPCCASWRFCFRTTRIEWDLGGGEPKKSSLPYSTWVPFLYRFAARFICSYCLTSNVHRR